MFNQYEVHILKLMIDNLQKSIKEDMVKLSAKEKAKAVLTYCVLTDIKAKLKETK